QDAQKIIAALKAILKDLEQGKLRLDPADEDIHMAIEKELIRRIGEAGGKLHAARSRNDQILLDERLYLRAEIQTIAGRLTSLQRALVQLAKREIKTIMPGYTHMQKAQPVLLSHYLLAFADMFGRDVRRLQDCRDRTNVLPLGAAALAGTGLPINRAETARLLNFPGISTNSMDTVADRDFIAEFIFDAALIMMHLSRFCEDLVLWSSEEFGFIEISDAYTTGSSIMPQKKNPDVAELIRGKTGRVYGDLFAILTLLKGLPMTYNRDLQEDKEPLFDAVDTVKSCLSIFCEMINNTRFHSAKMAASASKGFSTATEIAEYLVEKKVPFRRAHDITGKIVAYCLRQKKDLQALTLKEYQAFYRGIQSDILDRIQPESAVRMRGHIGGTAPQTVLQRIKEFEKRFSKS
ncbi:MAG TPA: argininosuccinate lyase, partial [Smithella sp.]|nr:argininosuccinate lyase [Smithella sp.]